MSPEKWKLKQRDATEHPLEWPKFGILRALNAADDMELQKLSFIPGGNAKWYNHLGRHFGRFSQN